MFPTNHNKVNNKVASKPIGHMKTDVKKKKKKNPCSIWYHPERFHFPLTTLNISPQHFFLLSSESNVSSFKNSPEAPTSELAKHIARPSLQELYSARVCIFQKIYIFLTFIGRSLRRMLWWGIKTSIDGTVSNWQILNKPVKRTLFMKGKKN